jgi:Rrf2 family protein
MIGIGRQTDYAARIVLHLSALPKGAQATTEDIAKKRLLPRAFMRRIVVRLAAANILRTVRGAGGGIALARPASQISLLDIVTAMEGELMLNACVHQPMACPLSAACPVQRTWTDATKHLHAFLSSVHFDRLGRGIEKKIARSGYATALGAKAGTVRRQKELKKGGKRGRT